MLLQFYKNPLFKMLVMFHHVNQKNLILTVTNSYQQQICIIWGPSDAYLKLIFVVVLLLEKEKEKSKWKRKQKSHWIWISIQTQRERESRLKKAWNRRRRSSECRKKEFVNRSESGLYRGSRRFTVSACVKLPRYA